MVIVRESNAPNRRKVVFMGSAGVSSAGFSLFSAVVQHDFFGGRSAHQARFHIKPC